MQEEAINSIEWAVLAAAFVLTARLVSLIGATRGVASAHSEVISALGNTNAEQVERKVRGIGYRNPYGEVASEILNAAYRESKDREQSREFVERAFATVESKWSRRTQQGRALDLVALVVGTGVVIFSPRALPTGPLFWSCGGAMPVLLLTTFFIRGQLLSNLLTSAVALKSALLSRPELPSLSDGPGPCLWCGHTTTLGSYTVTKQSDNTSRTVDAVLCETCGKFVANL